MKHSIIPSNIVKDCFRYSKSIPLTMVSGTPKLKNLKEEAELYWHRGPSLSDISRNINATVSLAILFSKMDHLIEGKSGIINYRGKGSWFIRILFIRVCGVIINLMVRVWK